MPYDRYEGAAAFYNSKAWKKCRKSYIESVNGLCESCLDKGDIVPGYIVHHKIPLNASNINDPDITLNHKHLRYDCLFCHNKEILKEKSVTAEGLTFNENGELIRV